MPAKKNVRVDPNSIKLHPPFAAPLPAASAEVVGPLGTNDLFQCPLALDRADEAVAHLYDPWHPAVLQLVSTTIHQARSVGRGVSVCGEMAGDPIFTELLLAMGLRSFSMHPSQIASVKQRVLRADTRRLASLLEPVLSSDDPEQTCTHLFASAGTLGAHGGGQKLVSVA